MVDTPFPGLDRRIMCMINGENTHCDGSQDSIYSDDLYEDFISMSEIYSQLEKALKVEGVVKFLQQYFIDSQTDLGNIYKFFSEKCNVDTNPPIKGIDLLQNIASNFSFTLNLLGNDVRDNFTVEEESCDNFTVGTICYLGFLNASEMFLRWYASILKLCLCEAESRTPTPYVAHYVVAVTPFLAQFVSQTCLNYKSHESCGGATVGVLRSINDNVQGLNTLCVIDDSPFTRVADLNCNFQTMNGCLSSFNLEKESFLPKNCLTKDGDGVDRINDTKEWLIAQIQLIQSKMLDTPIDSPLYKEQERIIAYYELRLADLTKQADEDHDNQLC